ncbi:sugar phosphate isomerase/epimerase family protein [Paenibacillus radicis (ex Gao et al. 2016)]|uniref:Sugar phosphate isomerase n=1 Tax=Paenibacillus radicis (ex Gao et al. 2016) TaxID=1737354 RepID=A0A917M3E3_9BACL|nr:sugar phosphate isomerase/epimerase [Paenibacillus radicis (ex Gao et al. 2016)]GGG75238.1 sugar phosphate isomerase [Paenibacillus radicis (ex Gao et al. 2016)]
MSKITGAQLYTIRDFVKTPEEIDQSLRKIKEIGYTTIQASGMGPIPPEELAAIARSHGLQIVLTHMPYERFVNDLDGLIRDHHTLGCGLAGIGGLPAEYRNADGYVAFAAKFNAIAKELAQNGLKFSYHNHHFEFEKHNGKLGIETLLENTDPESFLFTLDTYWVQAGGADPSSWIRKMKGRIEAIHLKDMAIIDEKTIMAEVLEGNLEWPDIFQACEEADVKWYLVERDAGPTDAFESLSISYRNLKKAGFE